MKKLSLTLCASAGLLSPAAFATDSAVISADANIVAPTGDLSITNALDLSFGDLVLPQSGTCEYSLFSDGIKRSRNTQSGVVTTNNLPNEGCVFGIGERSVGLITVGCEANRPVAIEISSTSATANTFEAGFVTPTSGSGSDQAVFTSNKSLVTPCGAGIPVANIPPEVSFFIGGYVELQSTDAPGEQNIGTITATVSYE